MNATGRNARRLLGVICVLCVVCAGLLVTVALVPAAGATPGAPETPGGQDAGSPGAGCVPRESCASRAVAGSYPGLTLWQQACVRTLRAEAKRNLRAELVPTHPAGVTANPGREFLPGLAQAEVSSASGSSPTTRQALVPALMSAVVPGAGQLRNGSVLRGLTFAALEITGWMAWLSFRHQSENKRDDLVTFSGEYWDYDRYQRVAQDPDSCLAAGCGCDNWSVEADSLIAEASARGGNRFYDYVTRDIYACGWDTQLSRDLYLGLWDDREDLLDAKRLSGRLIFLNHVVSAVDAFLQARRVRVAGVAQLGVRLADVPREPHPQLVFGTTFD